MFLSSYAINHQVAKATPFAAAENLHELFSSQPREHLEASQAVFFEGDDAKHIFEVVEGTLRLFRILSDGRRVITGFLYAGDIVGVSLRNKYLYGAEAIGPASVRRISRKAFEEAVADSDALRPEVFSRICDEMAAVQDQLVLLSSKTAEERLCTFLLKHLQRSLAGGSPDAVIELPMTRQDMADHLGLTIETVSRTITKLIGKGVLKVANPVARHFIRIEKPAKLVQLSGDGRTNPLALRVLPCHRGRLPH
ncbi:Crp/Fnr family transcriptional regulator [Neorhizobium alkalisoli]|uniref:Crp/Fnr family transcriptional regulator n=1 Tax=Neorhizobium alkalisoli TaxID=528178 RepID=UPI000CF8F1A1|nr:helix-turn-helix domain-containing protein [Neorhizobium alkalisoli]